MTIQPVGPLGWPFTPVPDVQPFTFKDGRTFLIRLRDLQDYIYQTTQCLETLINQVETNVTTANDALANELTIDLNNTIAQWNAILAGLVDSQTVRDVVMGGASIPLNTVLGELYDNTRVYAYFTDQLDSFEATAAQYDALEFTARQFDLNLAYTPTADNAVDVIPPAHSPFA